MWSENGFFNCKWSIYQHTTHKMAIEMINDILQDNWDSDLRKFKDCASNLYFFLSRELTVTNKAEYTVAKSENRIRHCIPYKGRYFDYIVKKEFATLHEWAADCGSNIRHVKFGSNRVHTGSLPDYISLRELLATYGYIGPLEDELKLEIPEVDEVPTVTTTELTEMLDIEMRFRGLSIKNVWVIQDSIPMRWDTFVSTV